MHAHTYTGATSTLIATFVGHWPWFVVHNLLDKAIKAPTNLQHALYRNAFIGLVSSAASDIFTNSIRIVKTIKQANAASGKELSHVDIVRQILEESGKFTTCAVLHEIHEIGE
jgi:hypothetical protein